MTNKINLNLTIIISITIIIIALLSYLLYQNYYEGLIAYSPGYPPDYPGLFNVGTRQLAPTHLMSYDVRGDVPVGYYPIGIFNEPENLYGRRFPRYNEPNFYTPYYINPYQGFYPSMYNSTFSVPFKVDENDGGLATTNWKVKPVQDSPN
jgi:hypothetical protein